MASKKAHNALDFSYYFDTGRRFGLHSYLDKDEDT
jgi:hypothetical protein